MHAYRRSALLGRIEAEPAKTRDAHETNNQPLVRSPSTSSRSDATACKNASKAPPSVITADTAIAQLLESNEPALQLGVQERVLRVTSGAQLDPLRSQIPKSKLAVDLVSERRNDGKIPRHPYSKWDGAHWVLYSLADLGYPPGDDSLTPLREQVLDWLLSPGRAQTTARMTEGRARFCASQEGNAIHYLLMLGLADERIDLLVDRLLESKWPDGGWNCDRRAQADTSSFHETLLPLRALALHARLTGSSKSRQAADRAAEVFLSRSLFRRRRDGAVIHPNFLLLHYPAYWHYDLLAGLKVMSEFGYVHDERCSKALDLLETKQRPDETFPAEVKYWRLGNQKFTGRSLADWGSPSKRAGNAFVTLDALAILRPAGRLKPSVIFNSQFAGPAH